MSMQRRGGGASCRRSPWVRPVAARLRRHVEIDDEGGRATEFPFSRGCSFYEVWQGPAAAAVCDLPMYALFSVSTNRPLGLMLLATAVG
jgi:hypothetical protein